MACRSTAGRELAAVILPTAGCSEEERKIDVARCWWTWSWDCRQCQSPPTLVVLSLLQCWQSMLLPQATETQTGDQGLDSAWGNGWNVFNGAWAAQPSSVPKLWESLASAILDRKLLGAPKEEHMWASERGGVSALCGERGRDGRKWMSWSVFCKHPALHYPARTILVGRENRNPFIYHL